MVYGLIDVARAMAFNLKRHFVEFDSAVIEKFVVPTNQIGTSSHDAPLLNVMGNGSRQGNQGKRPIL